MRPLRMVVVMAGPLMHVVAIDPDMLVPLPLPMARHPERAGNADLHADGRRGRGRRAAHSSRASEGCRCCKPGRLAHLNLLRIGVAMIRGQRKAAVRGM